jgi:hypothetical protein
MTTKDQIAIAKLYMEGNTWAGSIADAHNKNITNWGSFSRAILKKFPDFEEKNDRFGNTEREILEYSTGNLSLEIKFENGKVSVELYFENEQMANKYNQYKSFDDDFDSAYEFVLQMAKKIKISSHDFDQDIYGDD